MESQEAVKQILKQAQSIRYHSKTANHRLQSYLRYQFQQISQPQQVSTFKCCTSNRSFLKKQFKSAFKQLSRVEQAQFYLKNCIYVSECLEGKRNIEPPLEQTCKKFKGFYLSESLFPNFTKWKTCEIFLEQEKLKLALPDLKQEYSLAYYLMKKVKDRNQYSIKLIATQERSLIRSPLMKTEKQQQFMNFFKSLQRLHDAAQRQFIETFLKKQQIKNKQTNCTGISQKMIPQVHQLNQKQAKEANSIQECQKDSVQEIPEDLLNQIDSFEEFENLNSNYYYIKKTNNNIIKQKYILNKPKMHFWLIVDQFRLVSNRAKWKEYLVEAAIIEQQNYGQKQILYQNYKSNSGQELISYYYKRVLKQQGCIVYFYDHSIQYPHKQNEKIATIKYCLWKLQKIESGNISIIVQAHIQNNASNQSEQNLSDKFIGNFSQFQNCIQEKNNTNQHNLQNLKYTSFTENQYSQISKKQKLSFELPQQEVDEYLSMISCSHMSLNVPQVSSHKKSNVDIIISSYSLSYQQQMSRYPHSSRYDLNPMQVKQKRLRQSIQGKHFLLAEEWAILPNGDAKNINKEKIKAQSRVLKEVAQSIWRKLIKGQNILNISLPVGIFGKDSMLERIAQRFTYAPLLLDHIDKTDPIQRCKAVFSLSVSVVFLGLEMSKPFNPILGQTYQGRIDGCPIYGEQLSHHPPISYIFMKGRGYFIYREVNPKIQLGFNSVTGNIQGLTYVSFHENNYRKNLVSFSSIAGTMHGLLYGDRYLRFRKKCNYWDRQNQIYSQILWGKNKDKNDDPQSNFEDFVYGKVYKMNNHFSEKGQLKGEDIEKQLGVLRGRWSQKIFWNQELLLDLQKAVPFILQEQKNHLESQSSRREDIQYRRINNLVKAQQNKQKLEDLQRYDLKLRQKFNPRRWF